MVSSSASSFELAGGADTIVAPATPPGSGALAVIRVSGPAVRAVAASVCPRLDVESPRRAQLVSIRDGAGRRVERGIVIPYRAPASYTGEDMLEVMVHGSPALTGSVVGAFVEAGCRHAEPGEFTRRAVANGKIDLVQAEGIAALVEAETSLQASVWRAQVDGSLSHRFQALRGGLVELVGRLEAALDFSAQGVDVDRPDLEGRRAALVDAMGELLSTVRRGRRIRDGVRVVILGPPNAGKSTLFNRLLRSERAIVAPEPGTTRDFLEAELEIGGLRVMVVDTAGVARGGDAIEREGIRRSQELAQTADLIILVESVIETPQPVPALPAGKAVLRVKTKIDLVEKRPVETAEGGLAISALTGEGWEELEETLSAALLEEVGPLEGRVVVNERQGKALERAMGALQRAPIHEPELAVEELRGALDHLGELLGDVTSEEVLDAVFSTFCLGK